MQLEGSSRCAESRVAVSVHFLAFVDRYITDLFTNFYFSKWRVFWTSKMAGWRRNKLRVFIGQYFSAILRQSQLSYDSCVRAWNETFLLLLPADSLNR